MRKHKIQTTAAKKKETLQKKMNSYKNLFELIDISSSEDEEGTLERASTPLPRMVIPNYRIIPETSQSSIEATAD